MSTNRSSRFLGRGSRKPLIDNDVPKFLPPSLFSIGDIHIVKTGTAALVPNSSGFRNFARTNGGDRGLQIGGSRRSRPNFAGGHQSNQVDSASNSLQFHAFGFSRLAELVAKPADEVLLSLDKSSKNLFLTTTQSTIRGDLLILLVQIIGEKLCSDSSFSEIQNRLVAMVTEPKLLDKVKTFSLELVIGSHNSSRALEFRDSPQVDRSKQRFLEAQHAWYVYVNAKMPNLAADLILFNVKSAQAAIQLLTLSESSYPTLPQLQERYVKLQQNLEDFISERNQGQLDNPSASSVPSRKRYRDQLSAGDVERLYLMEPDEHFTSIEIVPTTQEILTDEKPFLRPNLIQGKYPSVKTYLDVQFRLLREDFVAPLRESIQEYMSNESAYKNRKKKLPPGSIRFYQDVKLSKVEVMTELTIFLMKFSLTPNLRRIKWDRSKRLLNGSLTLLTPDQFKTIYFATVTRRDEKELSRDGIIGITWEGEKPPDLYGDAQFLMVECEVYFEAYRHPLKALQLMAAPAPPNFDVPLFQKYPMAKYIVDMSGDKIPPPPKYLVEGGSRKLDFSMILSCNEEQIRMASGVNEANLREASQIGESHSSEDSSEPASQIRILAPAQESEANENQAHVPIKPHFASPIDFSQWPKAEDIGLDAAQYLAFRSAITQELSLIQGPPGTGKTYIGLLIMKLLLSNPKIIWTQSRLRRASASIESEDSTSSDDGDTLQEKSTTAAAVARRLRLLRGLQETPAQVAPILVVCYTNHALDQFLEGIVEIMKVLQIKPEGNLIRVGGRSKVESLADFSIHKQREYYQKFRRFDSVYASSRYKARAELRELQNLRSDLKDVFKGLQYPEGIINLTKLDSELALTANISNQLMDTIPTNLRQYFSSPQNLTQFLGLTQHFFKYDNFDAMAQFRRWFRTSAPVHQPKIPVPLASTTQVLPTEDQNEDEEDYDMEELMANRLNEEIVYEVDKTNQRHTFQISYAHSIYWGTKLAQKRRKLEDQLNLPGIRADFSKQQEICKELKKLEMDEIYQRNQSNVLQLILQAIRDERLNLPEVTQDVLARVQAENPNPQQKSYAEKWAIYQYYIQTAKKLVAKAINETESRILRAQTKLAEINNHGDGLILKGAKVVGLTTTGAAKYSQLLKMMKCRIVIIEEAAEVLEASVVTSITEHCEHLILIGDHQQLRPTTTVYKLAKDFNLEISLFERLIMNNFSWQYLKAQHRMRPEICKLLVPTIYKELDNHSSVMNYPNALGMAKNLFFFTHNNFEKDDNDSMTKSNEFEARFLIKLCRHLLLQGYQKSQITIITTYLGQMFLLRKIIEQDNDGDQLCRGVRVTVVDNFQGEENDIILLSLVRSNVENRIGFLQTSNRINVALSRAKHGLYIVGNMDCILKSSSPIWSQINHELEEQESVNDYLELKCEIHNQIIEIRYPEDFQLHSPEGGCTQNCPGILPFCNHSCRLTCHIQDRNHLDYRCQNPCQRQCPAEEHHDCPSPCFMRPCPPCMVPMDRNLPCGHPAVLSCYIDIETYPCQEKVIKELPCKHEVRVKCSTSIVGMSCNVRMDRTLDCGHHKDLPCHQPVSEWICYELRERELSCGDFQTVKCSDDIELIQCETIKPRDLPCGHSQMVRCSLATENAFCETLVPQKMPKCGHDVDVRCCAVQFSDSWECTSKCDTRLRCGHSCRRSKCHIDDDPDHVYLKCQEPCQKNCVMGHPCDNKKGKHTCHQPCPPCIFKVDKSLGCGHAIRVACSQETETLKCVQPCVRSCSFGHPCQKKCFETCAPCRTLVEKSSLDCPHTLKVQCAEIAEKSKCIAPTLPISSSLCGHAVEVPCNIQHTVTPEQLLKYCQHPCGHKYSDDSKTACSHPCQGDCSTCFQGRIHMKCNQKCERTLACGHICKFPCSKLCPPCNEPCLLTCGHSKCKKQCGFPCTDCKEKCNWECPHQKCTKLCDEECNRVGCNELCPIKLPCSHDCIGMCGEPCPQQCQECNKEEVEAICFGTEDMEGARFVLLEDCNHVVEVGGMDTWMTLEQEQGEIGVKRCPKCTQIITKSVRYRQLLKKRLKDVLDVRNRIFGNASMLKDKQRKVTNILSANNDMDYQLEFVRKTLRIMCCIIERKRVKGQWITTYHPKEIDQYLFQTVDNIMSWWKEAERNLKLKPNSTMKMPQINPPSQQFARQSTKAQTKELRQEFTPECHQDLICRYKDIFNILLNRVRPLTGREIDDFENEFERHNDLCRLYRRQGIEDFDKYPGGPPAFSALKEHLTQIKPYTKPMKQIFIARLKNLDSLLKTGWTKVEQERRDRSDLFTAVGMAANHWYRCRNGHLYTVGDCGALNEPGRCPECRSNIGGGSQDTHFGAGTDEAVRTQLGSTITIEAPDFTFGEASGSNT